MSDYRNLLQHSTDNPQQFWRAQSRRIEWQQEFSAVFDDSAPPATKWFVGGRTNLCHNAVDRHLASRGEQQALVFVSAETGQEHCLTYRQLHREVNIMAAVFQNMGVQAGDRVLLYLPMIIEAAVAMLACARIGAVHSVVFGGFAADSLASRIDDARPALVVCADAGFQNSLLVNYKQLMDAALQRATHAPPRLLLIDRQLAPYQLQPQRDHGYAEQRQAARLAEVPCHWLESNAPSYLLYTSGTSGKPKGVQRDIGGHAVALATSMALLFEAAPGEVMLTTSDLGWVVGHSYGLYAPLLAGLTSVLLEGAPTRPDAGFWWRLVQRHQVNLMLSSATAMRLLQRHGLPGAESVRGGSLRALFLAGEPLDHGTAQTLEAALGVPVIDHYWQTETGAPMIGLPYGDGAPQQQAGTTALPPRQVGSPGLGTVGYRLAIIDAESGRRCAAGKKGILMAEGMLPPGCLTTLWGQDEQYRSLYWCQTETQGAGTATPAWRYSTFDWAVADEAGYIRILGRADDVINVAGKRIGTREIEEIMLASEMLAEIAVVGMPHVLRGQIPIAFAVLKNQAEMSPAQLKLSELRLIDAVGNSLGALARPKRVLFVASLPRTRSGKVLRRLIQEVIGSRSLRDLADPGLPLIIADLAQAFHAGQQTRPQQEMQAQDS